ncbi:MAG: PUR family DNA/RNA-binding protein [Flavobacteriaceae bacterium]
MYQEDGGAEEIYSKVLRAGRRTYFFDVRETKASDYYLTITESKKFTNEDGSYYYKKHKLYLYKEDFSDFKSLLEETMNFIIEERGEEVISERHKKNYNPDENTIESSVEESSNFSDLNFEDI